MAGRRLGSNGSLVLTGGRSPPKKRLAAPGCLKDRKLFRTAGPEGIVSVIQRKRWASWLVRTWFEGVVWIAGLGSRRPSSPQGHSRACYSSLCETNG